MANGTRKSSSIGGTTRKINTKKVNEELRKSQRSASSRGGSSQQRSSSNPSQRSSQSRSGQTRNTSQRPSQNRSQGQSGTKHVNQTRISASKSAAVKKRKQQRAKKIMLVLELVIVLLFIVVGVFLLKKTQTNKVPQEDEIAEEVEETRTASLVDGIDISTMSKSELKDTLMNKYKWSMAVVLDDKRYEVENYMEKAIDSALSDAYSSFFPDTYTVEVKDIDTIAEDVARKVDETWSTPAKNAMITSFNSENGEFVYDEGQTGFSVDKEALVQDLTAALQAKQYDAQITAKVSTETTSLTAADYELIGTYTTKTTANEARNTNIKIASGSVNGTILQPGEQFSYNTCLGKRTPERGYKEAGAYANGEHVLEYGGGICQLSSTIYNAIIEANIQVDKRTGHTYEPSYVTPGEDAAVSYMNPDFVFTNNTKGSLGIKVSFADRTITVKIYGIRTLEEGVKRYLKSEKIGDVPPPPDVYVEDPAVPFGQSQVVVWPKNGSKWSTNIVLEKDGKVISDEYLHTTTYRGTAAEIHVNTQSPNGAPQPAPQPDPVPQEPQQPETPAPAPETPTPEEPAQ